MKTEKQGFIVLYEWLPILKAIGGNPDSKVVAILEALATVDQTGDLPTIDADLNELERLNVDGFVKTVAENRAKYIERCEINRQNALKGGRKPNGSEKNRTVAKGSKRNPEKPDKDKDIDIDKDLYIKKPKNSKIHNFDERDNTEVFKMIEERG